MRIETFSSIYGLQVAFSGPKTYFCCYSIHNTVFTAKPNNMDFNEKVLETLRSKGKAMKAGEIAEAAGVEKKEVEKSIKKLVAEGKLHSPVRCFYDIKK